MKKLIIIFLSAALVLGLCACGGNNNTSDADSTVGAADVADIRAAYEKADAYIGSIIDAEKAGMVTDEQDDNNGETLYKYWTYAEDKEGGKIDASIELEGETVTVGKTTVSELKELGYKIDAEVETVGANTVQGFSVTKDNKYSNLSVDNYTNSPQKFADMVINSAAGANAEVGGMSFDYKGIKSGSTLKDVVDALGVPNFTMTLGCDLSGNSIEVSYSCTTVEDGNQLVDTLTVNLMYDPSANVAKVSAVRIERTTIPAEIETTAE